MSELLNVSCKNFISRSMLLAHFTTTKTQWRAGENHCFGCLDVTASTKPPCFSAFPPLLREFCQTAFLGFSECLFCSRYVKGPTGERGVPVL